MDVNVAPNTFKDWLRFQYNTSNSKSGFFYVVFLFGWNKLKNTLMCRRANQQGFKPVSPMDGQRKRKNSDIDNFS